MSFKIGVSRDQEGQRQRRTTWTRRRVFTHAAVGRVENVSVNNDDRTWWWKPRWRSARRGGIMRDRNFCAWGSVQGLEYIASLGGATRRSSWEGSPSLCEIRSHPKILFANPLSSIVVCGHDSSVDSHRWWIDKMMQVIFRCSLRWLDLLWLYFSLARYFRLDQTDFGDILKLANIGRFLSVAPI